MPARLSIVTVALALLTAGASAATWSQPATLRSCAPRARPAGRLSLQRAVTAKRPRRDPLARQPARLRARRRRDAQRGDAPHQRPAGRRPQRARGPRAQRTAGRGRHDRRPARRRARRRRRLDLAEGPAGVRLRRVATIGAPATALAVADGYIGDADVVSVHPIDGRQAIELRAQRHYDRAFAPAVTMLEGAAPITSLGVALDFRADSLVTWAQSGEVHAQWVSNAGSVQPAAGARAGWLRPPDRGGAERRQPRLRAVVRDEPAPGSSAQTTIYLEHSAVNVTFSAPARAIATLSQPPAQRLGPGAVALVRVTPSEGVMALWPIMLDGDYAVQAAGLTSAKVLTPATISQIGADLRLAAIATGPRDDVVVVLERAARATAGGFDQTQQAILAARTVPGGPGGVAFEAPALLAPEGPNSARGRRWTRPPTARCSPGRPSSAAPARSPTPCAAGRSPSWARGRRERAHCEQAEREAADVRVVGDAGAAAERCRHAAARRAARRRRATVRASPRPAARRP